MRFSHIATYLAVGSNLVQTASLPNSDAVSIARVGEHIPRSDILAPENALEKRKGGGGGGGGGGRGGSSGSSSSSSGGKSGGSSSGGSSSSGARAGGLNGGSTRAGSGAPRAYGGGYYGGGASVPYKAGGKTGKGLGAGPILGIGAAAAIMPGLWLYSVYPYNYNNHYRFYNSTRRNETRNSTNQNNARFIDRLLKRQNDGGQEEDLPVVCLCQENSVCGCEENDDQQYLKDLVGNGSYAALNKTLVNVGDVNGTRKLILNGTLPEGTTAPGGEDAAAATLIGPFFGYWAIVLVVVSTVTLV